MSSQIKAKERVRQHGEVFTAPREVSAMLNMTEPCISDIDCSVLEPACGDGNFLVEILRRKMRTVFEYAGSDKEECEYLLLRAVSAIYGIDIMADNIEQARIRIYDNCVASIVNHCREYPSQCFLACLNVVLEQNIQNGDSLSGKNSDGTDLMITEWSFDLRRNITRSRYKFIEMVSSGCNCNPVEILPKVSYYLLAAVK